MILSFIRPLLFCLTLAFAVEAFPQDTLVVVFGTVKDYTTKEPLRDIEVEAIDQKWGRRLSTTTNEAGKYELDFTEEGTFMVEFSMKGRATKRILLDLTGPTPDEWVGGYGMNVDIMLFRQFTDLDLSYGGRPIGRSAYNRSSGNFEWDTTYTQGLQEETMKLIEAYNRRLAADPSLNAR